MLDRKHVIDLLIAAAVAAAVGFLLYVKLSPFRARIPIQAEMIVARGAAADVATLINSEAFQNDLVDQLYASRALAIESQRVDLHYLRAAATRPDLVQVRILAKNEGVGEALVNGAMHQVLQHPLRFQLAELGRRHATLEAIQEYTMQCASQRPAAAARLDPMLLSQIKLQSMFVAASLLREVELQGRADNFLEHHAALRSTGLERLANSSGWSSYDEVSAVYDHALCETASGLAQAQLAISKTLVKTEYRVLHLASAIREEVNQTRLRNLMLVVPLSMVAAWLVLWRRRRRAAWT